MIDHTYRCIYIHQRKTGGVSISSVFGLRNFAEEPASPFHKFNSGVESPDWSKRPQDYFVFSAVRNPFDRLISGWRHLPNFKDRPLEEIVASWPAKGKAFTHISRPQIQILREPETGTLVTHDLIRFESMQDDFDRICDRIGKPRMELPHINTSERERDYRKYFTPYTRRLAEEHFAEDLRVFGYEF